MKHRSANRIVILTGAGISAESGVPTFRDSGGLWEGHRVEDVASPAGFRRNPGLVHRFYNLRRADIQVREPNDAHRAIARLQKGFPESVTLITQNVDDLHERAGSPAVLHMHGELCTRLLDLSISLELMAVTPSNSIFSAPRFQPGLTNTALARRRRRFLNG